MKENGTEGKRLRKKRIMDGTSGGKKREKQEKNPNRINKCKHDCGVSLTHMNLYCLLFRF